MRQLRGTLVLGAGMAALLALAACGRGAPAQEGPSGQQGQAAATTDWCTPGTTWTAPAVAATGGVQQARIAGMADFKGKRYCKAEFDVVAEGQRGRYTYYFSEDGSDVWVVMDIGGQVQEFHVAGGS